MDSIKKRIYLHREKEDNYSLHLDLKEKGFNTENIDYLGYEIELGIEFFKDGTNRVISIEGIDVSDKDISI